MKLDRCSEMFLYQTQLQMIAHKDHKTQPAEEAETNCSKLQSQ